MERMPEQCFVEMLVEWPPIRLRVLFDYYELTEPELQMQNLFATFVMLEMTCCGCSVPAFSSGG